LRRPPHAANFLQMGEFDGDLPRPALVRFLEALAAMLDVRDERVELIFRGGRLEAYRIDAGLHRPADLGRYDGLCDELLLRVRV
jgi:hypothetical protein